MRYLYILKRLSQPLQMYVGVTGDVDRRIGDHNSGRCSHTAKFMPWQIVYTEPFDNGVEASNREQQIKGWTRAKKEALIAGDVEGLKGLARRRV